MLILGIETSSDETAAALVADGRHVLSSGVATQFESHAQYGGVVPELASRHHLQNIYPVVLLPVGYPDQTPKARPRFDLDKYILKTI